MPREGVGVERGLVTWGRPGKVGVEPGHGRRNGGVAMPREGARGLRMCIQGLVSWGVSVDVCASPRGRMRKGGGVGGARAHIEQWARKDCCWKRPAVSRTMPHPKGAVSRTIPPGGGWGIREGEWVWWVGRAPCWGLGFVSDLGLRVYCGFKPTDCWPYITSFVFCLTWTPWANRKQTKAPHVGPGGARKRSVQAGRDRKRPGETGRDGERPGSHQACRDRETGIRPGETGIRSGKERLGETERDWDQIKPGETAAIRSGRERREPGGRDRNQTGRDRDQTGRDRDQTGRDRDPIRPGGTAAIRSAPGVTGSRAASCFDRPGVRERRL